MKRSLLHGLAAAFLLSAAMAPALVAPVLAAEVVYSVNGEALTSYDVQRRAAFLKLQGKGGGTAAATEEMINQLLVMQEAEKMGVRTAQGEVDAAFERFAKSNNMSTRQMTQILNQAGVTATHFKEFVRAQMTGGQVIQLMQRQSGGGPGLSRQEIVKKMLERRDNQPTATEYVLQQVIFVVPPKDRSNAKIAARTREAEGLRARFQSCETTRSFAKGLIDVTVMDLGRVLAPELPGDWKDAIAKLGPGQATPVRTTGRGAEFIAVCRTREVSDDRVAELQIRAEAVQEVEGTDAGRDMVERLRKKAVIIKR
ncbi:MAG: SurA N-terminal domain-containing protein [Rhizobiaceae bacterium]|nr:SurA N-terminal domain-containing protein [Rhizobiaceae bacterium]